MGHGAWGMGHGAWGMGPRAWGLGHTSPRLRTAIGLMQALLDNEGRVVPILEAVDLLPESS